MNYYNSNSGVDEGYAFINALKAQELEWKLAGHIKYMKRFRAEMDKRGIDWRPAHNAVIPKG